VTFSALFLFSSSIEGLKIKQHKPFIYVFLFPRLALRIATNFSASLSQLGQLPCLSRASFHGRREHLQTAAHYKEDEEIKREAK